MYSRSVGGIERHPHPYQGPQSVRVRSPHGPHCVLVGTDGGVYKYGVLYEPLLTAQEYHLESGVGVNCHRLVLKEGAVEVEGVATEGVEQHLRVLLLGAATWCEEVAYDHLTEEWHGNGTEREQGG